MGIEGPVFAVVTPFDAAGEVDDSALVDYLQFLAGHGVRTLVVNGTTGEFASLTLPERMAVLECCRRAFDGTIVSHISSCCVQDSRTLLDHSREYADAVLLLPPFYYANVDPPGNLAFIRAILDGCDLPAYLYNFPEHTQSEISTDMFWQLAAQVDCLAGIKDSGGRLQLSQDYKRACPQLQVFVGSDRMALEVLKRGLDGSVTGCGSAVPEFLVDVQTRWKAGDLDAAGSAQRQLDAWTDFREHVPVNSLPLTKAALGGRIPGFPPYVRPPFITADVAGICAIRSALAEIVAGK
ncbi:MAG: dihydrodipicolinate synthase family protein [Planctomycetes bacterium]|nr:dihydrodipicolinate synthase family protein [Planctomycetota bacterium]